MCQEHVQMVIGRLAAYTDFRRLITTNPQLALQDYNLTLEEKSALRDVASSRFELDVDSSGNIQLIS